jgi:urease subunit gamma
MRAAACVSKPATERGGSVHFTPAETEKLLLAMAGMVARDRRERGILLNYPEAVALISTWVLEGAREGRSVSELMSSGQGVLQRAEVLPGVPEMLLEVQVEGTFPDGRKLVTIHHPID